MKKTWIFFKLRMLQLKSDKTALFFCYVFPVLLLLGIGYPLQLSSDPKIDVYYLDEAKNEHSAQLLKKLESNPMLDVKAYSDETIEPYVALAENQIKHLFHIMPAGQKPSTNNMDYEEALAPEGVKQDKYSLFLSKNSIDENRIENIALSGIISETLGGANPLQADQYTLKSDRFTSYLVTLLPGLIGLTLMIIGFNGFGGVLIEEENFGLFKNIKTIDVSPIPFLSGLFLSRLLVCYSVAAGLCLIAMYVFDIQMKFNFLLLLTAVTLGSISFLGVGLLIATISPSTTAFSGIVNFVQMPFIVLGGVFFSVQLFPEWVQYISMMIPLTQVNMAMQKILFESVSLNNVADLTVEFSVLLAWCIGSVILARYKFKW